MSHEGCQPPEVLEAFARGDLAEAELDAVAGHLESCPSCAEALARHDGRSDTILVDLLRRLGEFPRTARHLGEETLPGLPDSLDAGLSPPARLDEFRIVREIGRGGMGVVYEAFQESLGRHVAVKLLREPADLARFRREARAAGRLHHTNIVPIHGVGESDGRHFYVMQYIPGRGLDDVLRARRAAGEGTETAAVDFREVARIVLQAAEAVAYAHAQGIVHRDVKPSNLLLDERGLVWITDFGLAYDSADTQTLTQTGDLLGTIRYMAPERFAGRADAGADIYGLGITLYELATGWAAFADADRAVLIHRVMHQEPPRPRQVDPRVPRDLETIVLKAMAREPSHRYATAAEMAEDLRRFLEDRPVRARRCSETEKLLRWCRRNPAVATLGVLLAALLIVTTTGSLIVAARFRNQALAQRELAAEKEHERARAEEERRKTERALERAERSGRETLAARNEAVAEARRATLSEVRALRLGRPPGWRSKGLESLARLAERSGIQQDLAELRSEAVACLGELDFEEVARLEGGLETGGALAFSPDNTTLASMASEGTLILWDLRSWRALAHVKIPEHPGSSPRIQYQPGGGPPVILTGAGELRWLGPAPRPRIAVGEPARWFDFDRAGRRMAVLGTDDRVRVYDLSSGASLAEADCLDIASAISPDGSLLATVGRDGVIRLTEVSGGRPSTQLARRPVGRTRLAFSPDGASLACGDSTGTLLVWDVASANERLSVRAHPSSIRSLAFGPDGLWFATCGSDHALRVWEARTGILLSEIRPNLRTVMDVCFSPDGSLLAVSSEDGTSVVYAMRGRLERRRFEGHRDRIEGLVFDPVRLRLFSGSLDGTFIGWDLASGRIERRWAGAGAPWSMAASPDGAWLISGQFGAGSARLIHIDRDEPLRLLPGHATTVESVAIDSSGRTAVTGDELGWVRLYRLEDASPGWIVRAAPDWIESVAFIAGDRQVLVGCRSRGLVVLDARTGAELRSVPVPGGVDQFVLSPTRDRAWIATYTRTIRLLRLPELDAIGGTPVVHDAQIRSIALCPDGTMLATADASGSIVIHDAQALRPLFTLPIFTSWVEQVAFDPGSNLLAVAGANFEVTLWDLGPIRVQLSELGLGFGPARGSHPDVVSEGLRPTKVRVARLFDGETAAGPGRADLEPADRLVEAAALLEADDRRGYRRLCAAALERSAEISDPTALERLAWMCALAPDAVDDPSIPVHLAEAAVAGAPTDRVGDCLDTLAAALCRADRSDAAVRLLEDTIAMRGGRAGPEECTFLAMAHGRLGHFEEARRWLERSAGFRPGPEIHRRRIRWIERLRQEGEALLFDDTFPADPFAH